MLTLEPLPMEGAQKFWRDKVKLSPSQFNALYDEAKLKAFSVSGIAKGDELETVFDAMQRSIDKGETFGDFKKAAAAVFEKRGWTGKRAFRVETIFRTNIQTAYSVGRYKEMMEVSKTRPYWQYSAVNDSRTRPTHAAMHGKVFRYDHEFWDKWYPPNGFNCRCAVTTLSQEDVNSEGIKVETKDPTYRLIEPIDPSTGNKMPARALIPDRGFDFNPGKAYWQPLTAQPIDVSYETAGILSKIGSKDKTPIENIPTKKLTEEMLLSPHQKSGLNQEGYINIFLKEFGAEIGKPVVFKDVIGEPLVISEDFFKDRKTGEYKVTKADREIHLKMLADTIKDPAEIWLTLVKGENKIRVCRRYVQIYEGQDGKIGGFAIFDLLKDVWKGTTTFQIEDIDYLNKQRAGNLLYRKIKKPSNEEPR